MKFLISYFYQIRFFKENMIPISTAMWDPNWFKGGLRKDKRGIWLGLNDQNLHPPTDSECITCTNRNPDKCSFSKAYYEKISKLDFAKLIDSYKRLGEGLGINDPIIVLMVHEAPSNPCSERSSLIKWFTENGIELKEFNKDETV